MSFNTNGEEGGKTEIVAKQLVQKGEPKKRNRKKKQLEEKDTMINNNEMLEECKQSKKQKTKVNRNQGKGKQIKSRKRESKKEREKDTSKEKLKNGRKQKRNRGQKSKQNKKNTKEKKIRKKKEPEPSKGFQLRLKSRDLYEEEMDNKLTENENLTINNNPSFSQMAEVRDEVKHQFQNSSQSDDANIREIYMAQKLHAFREQLQINKITQINQEDMKSNKSRSLKMKDTTEEDDTPTDSEIEYLIELLSQKYSKVNLENTMKMLYKCLIKKDSKGNDSKNLQEELLKSNDKTATQKYAKLMRCVQGNLRGALADKSGKNIVKRYIKNPKYEERFQREEDRAKYSEKQIVAKAFCERQYGMSALLLEIRQSGAQIIIQRNRYKSLVTCVVNEAYRKLEEFLIEECKRDIKPLNREEIRTLYTTLLNCRTHFEDEECLTFIKFLKLAYQIQSVTITEQAAIKLYIMIQRALKVRIGELQLDRTYDTMRCNKEFKARRSFQNQKFQIHRIWNNEIQAEFLNFYKRNQQFAKIRDYFKTKFVEHQHLFTIDSLRSRFHKIIRMALRKTNCFCQKFGKERVPQMIKMNDVKAKFLLRSPDALNARLFLVDMYLNDQCDIKRLYQTVSAVNEFIIMKDNERMNQMIEAEPLFNSAAQKIQHNVNISKTKLTSKLETSHQLYYKGKQMNYDHIVQTANGKHLHYYRKPANNQLRDFRENDIKVEETGVSVRVKEGTMETLVHELADNDKWLGSSCASRYGSVSEGSMKMSQQSFNKMIQEQMQKFNKKSAQNYPIYR